jgi:hypothetical protein
MDISFDAYYHQYTSPVPLCSLTHVGLRALDLEELEENGSVFMLANSPASCSNELSSDLLHDEEFVYFGVIFLISIYYGLYILDNILYFYNEKVEIVT